MFASNSTMSTMSDRWSRAVALAKAKATLSFALCAAYQEVIEASGQRPGEEVRKKIHPVTC